MNIVAGPPSSSVQAPTTAPRPPTSPSPRGKRTRRGLSPRQLALASLVLFILALTPRLAGLEQHLTADDQDWIRRASRFGVAVQRGSFRETFQTAHPAVPLLWLAAGAMGPERSAQLASRSGNLTLLEKTPVYLDALFDVRRALAVVSAALTVLLAYLTWRLFGWGAAVLAGLLLAFEPFLVAHGRLFHADPLLAQLMAIAVLAALVFFNGKGSRGYLIGSGLATGLALLTKAPAILLLGFVPLVGLISSRDRAGRFGRSELRTLVIWLGLWALAAGAISLLLWPALWVEPVGTLSRMVQAVRSQSETPRTWGNFFLGQAYKEDDVGPLFYPLVTLLRLSPVTLAGLLALIWFSLRRQGSWKPAAAVLLDYVLLFTLMMTLSPKKIDRYVLPVYPVLAILAAVGLDLALRSASAARFGGRRLGMLAVGIGQAALVASAYPYPLSFYDPLFGGARTAQRAVVVGWGEGTDQVASYLERQPDAANIVVTSIYHDLIQPQFPGTGVPLWEWQRADYLADYINMDQRNLVPGPLQTLVRTQPPVFTAWVNGLEYVRLYHIPPELRAGTNPGDAPRRNLPRP